MGEDIDVLSMYCRCIVRAAVQRIKRKISEEKKNLFESADITDHLSASDYEVSDLN